MSRSGGGLIRLLSFIAISLMAVPVLAQSDADDAALWKEFGLVQKTTAAVGQASATVYRMKDLTGALAAWEWQRSAAARTCDWAAFCSREGKTTTLTSDNYVVRIDGTVSKADVDAFVSTLPNRPSTSLPAILTFVPRKNLVPNTARYILGPASLGAFAAPLKGVQPGFELGAEAQIAQYQVGGGDPVHLALFYYPTPEMARLRFPGFKALPGARSKRSNVLVAVIYGPATDQQANALLGHIEYEAHIRWNEIPPPSPIKPLYQLLLNIIFMSLVLSALCLCAGLIYAGIRLYRRRYGTLDEDEAMTTLKLSGD